MELQDRAYYTINYNGKSQEFYLSKEGAYGMMAGFYCLHKQGYNINLAMEEARPSPLIQSLLIDRCHHYLGSGMVTIHRNHGSDCSRYPFVTFTLKDEVDMFLDYREESSNDFDHPYYITMRNEQHREWRAGEEKQSINADAFQFEKLEFLIGLKQAFDVFGLDYKDYIIGGEYPSG